MPIEKTRQKLSKRVVDALEPGQAVWDAELRGFGARRQQRDVSFVLKYSFQGRQRFFTLGRHGVLTVEQARVEARRLLGLVASGTDPARLRDEAAAAKRLTVAELCALYLKEGPAFKPNKRASSWYTDRSNINRHIGPLLGDKDAETLSEADVVNFLADVIDGKTKLDEKTGTPRGRAIVRGGRGIAARALAVLGALFEFGIRRKLVLTNPTKNVKAPKGKQPGRYLTDDEWRRLGAAMEYERDGGASSVFIDAINLLALTGCRRSEITGLRWSEVDLRRGLIHLENSKAGPRVVPLGDHAILFLEELAKASNPSSWVFPSRRGTGPIVGIQKIWDRVCERAELANVRLHDLRHSFASHAVNSGASLYLTGAILGHRQSSTTQRYAHLQSNPVRMVASTVTQGIIAAMRGRKAP